ncbi:uncharacterized protein LOC127836977 isoform X1 [Dreissena polymorpha]|uniref:uncharacterized protein LOC127836977 isoform X1 n=1 Tax=Dreissena polymorpha TaxID=45954 RepID=UPI0022649DBC|nr:uncharacterized protein LOC127836977 isoform X1 [Dreissena polymorpha]
MRKSQTFTESQRDQRLCVKNGLTDQALKKCVCEQFSTTAEQVQIVHFDMKTEGSALKTTVVILPKIVQNMPFNKLLIETYTNEHRLSRIICGLWKADIKVDEFKQMLMEFLGWKSIALCKDGRIIYNGVEDQLRENQDLTRVQAFQFGHMKVTLVYSINADIEYRFICTLNGAKSVLEAKEGILTKFSREFEAIDETKGQILHLCIRDQIIQDDICLGVAMQSITRSDDTPISLHFASQDAITVTIVSNELKMRQTLLIVPRRCSTAYLRERIGKLAACDANSIKLVFNEKLIDELDDLSQTYGNNWKSGCTLNVGLKKQKTLKIKNPINNEEKAFKMYMLEPVQKLVERISAYWNLDVLTMCLFCRDVPMKCNSLLQHYAIKNNMQLELKLFPNRIAIQVRIVFKKRTLNLAVADSTVTAVEDLLTYCAVKMQYPRKCSRAILRNKCLKPEASLKDEGFSTNEKVSIVFFDEPLSGNSELIPVFEADIDGHTTPRYGKVVEGLLLLAVMEISSSISRIPASPATGER